MSKWVDQCGRVGVLMGGTSSERDISLQSGKAIVSALDRQGFDVFPLDIVDSDQDKIALHLRESNMDVAFIALHGCLGEDGVIQFLLEKVGIPYTGSGIDANRCAFNKAITQNLFKKNNISIPSYVTLSKGDPLDVERVMSAVGVFPLIVKPACEGSSIGITLVEREDQLDDALRSAWNYDPVVLIEKYIQGRELTVGILGADALPVVEICPKASFFNFEAKYTKGKTEYIVPAQIPDDMTQELQRVALYAHQLLGCADFSRVDFMVDADQKHYVLEINTIPGFTLTSLLPKAALAYGLTFDQLCFQLTEFAYGKKEKVKNITVR